MRDKPSFLHLIWTQGSAAMNEAIALEVKTICRRAAEPVLPGESITAQLRRAWDNLGRPPFWRVRAGWYDDRAGNWSAAAVKDFQDRYVALIARNSRRAVQARAIEDAKQSVSPKTMLEQARDEFRSLESRIAAIETALRLRTEDMGRS
jgi:hypothetical protein